MCRISNILCLRKYNCTAIWQNKVRGGDKMNQNQTQSPKRPRPKRKNRGATVAAVLCFVAAIAIVGTYTFKDYKAMKMNSCWQNRKKRKQKKRRKQSLLRRQQQILSLTICKRKSKKQIRKMRIRSKRIPLKTDRQMRSQPRRHRQHQERQKQ